MLSSHRHLVALSHARARTPAFVCPSTLCEHVGDAGDINIGDLVGLVNDDAAAGERNGSARRIRGDGAAW